MSLVRRPQRFLLAGALAAALTLGNAWPALASHPDPAEVEELELRRDDLEDRRQGLRRQQNKVEKAVESLVRSDMHVSSRETTGGGPGRRDVSAERRLLRFFAESDRIATRLRATAKQHRRVEARLAEAAPASAAGKQSSAPRLFHPTPGYAFGSPFGERLHPITRTVRLHAGVDIGAPAGTPVLAAADGTVSHAGWMGGYGLTVDIVHGNGLMTRYAHLSEILVSPGHSIGHQEPLGNVGSTGQSTGPHLHFEVHRDGTPTDPSAFYGG